MESKITILKMIKEKKDVLFTKVRQENSLKLKNWEEIANFGKIKGLLQSNVNGDNLRNVIWQNWRRRAIAKKNSGTKIHLSDNLVLDIIGNYISFVTIFFFEFFAKKCFTFVFNYERRRMR